MDAANKIKVLIVDDHEMTRHGLRILFENFDDIELVGETGDAHEVLDLCARYQPDIVLMDLVMPEMDGIAATELMHDKVPSIKVVALTSLFNEQLIPDALKAGAITYIYKAGSIDDIAETLRTAYKGGTQE